MKKILILNNSYWNFYNFRFLLIKELTKKFKVVLGAQKDRYFKFVPKNIKKNYFELNASGVNFFYEAKSFFLIGKIIYSERPDLIISFTPKINLYTSILCSLLNKKNISVFTGLGNLFLGNIFKKYFLINLFKIVFKNNSLIIFQNRFDLNLFIKKKIILKKQAKLIEGSGVDLKKFKYKKLEKKKYLVFYILEELLKIKELEIYYMQLYF